VTRHHAFVVNVNRTLAKMTAKVSRLFHYVSVTQIELHGTRTNSSWKMKDTSCHTVSSANGEFLVEVRWCKFVCRCLQAAANKVTLPNVFLQIPPAQ